MITDYTKKINDVIFKLVRTNSLNSLTMFTTFVLDAGNLTQGLVGTRQISTTKLNLQALKTV